MNRSAQAWVVLVCTLALGALVGALGARAFAPTGAADGSVDGSSSEQPARGADVGGAARGGRADDLGRGRGPGAGGPPRGGGPGPSGPAIPGFVQLMEGLIQPRDSVQIAALRPLLEATDGRNFAIVEGARRAMGQELASLRARLVPLLDSAQLARFDDFEARQRAGGAAPPGLGRPGGPEGQGPRGGRGAPPPDGRPAGPPPAGVRPPGGLR
jgi:hypothetical protein